MFWFDDERYARRGFSPVLPAQPTGPLRLRVVARLASPCTAGEARGLAAG